MSNRCHIRDIEICQDDHHEIFLSHHPSDFCDLEVRNISIIATKDAQEHGSKLVYSFTSNTQSKSHDSW
jgi:hypothetical protein